MRVFGRDSRDFRLSRIAQFVLLHCTITSQNLFGAERFLTRRGRAVLGDGLQIRPLVVLVPCSDGRIGNPTYLVPFAQVTN